MGAPKRNRIRQIPRKFAAKSLPSEATTAKDYPIISRSSALGYCKYAYDERRKNLVKMSSHYETCIQ